MMKEGAKQMRDVGNKLGLNIGTIRVFGPDHIVLAEIEADDIEAVRDFLLETTSTGSAKRARRSRNRLPSRLPSSKSRGATLLVLPVACARASISLARR